MTSKTLKSALLAAAFSAVLSAPMMTAPASAQETKPAAGTGANWSTNTTVLQQGTTLTTEQLAVVTLINDYFNGITNLQTQFLQTDANKQQLRGRFYMQRPSRFRFEYSRPSRLVILSDGKLLSYEDHALKKVDRYHLSDMPIAFLMREQVDILRDSRLLEIADNNNGVSVTLEATESDLTGRIQLVFAKLPDGKLELAEWVVTDTQGLATRVEFAALERPEELDPKLFQNSAIGLPNAQNQRR